MSRIERIRAHYEHRIAPHRENYDVLDWASAASQRKRFEVLVAHVPLRGKRLLDVGCGLGDLAAFLQDQDIDVSYTGVDVLAKMVESCRQRLPGERFVQGDVFADECFAPGEFDVVFTSGVFNLDLGNNMAFLPIAAERLLALSTECLVMNLLHAHSPYKEDGYFFYDPDAVVKLLRAEPCEIRLVDDYLPNDFTVICRKLPPTDPPGPS